MKSIMLLPLLAAGTVLAGENPPVYDPAPMPPAPNLYQWFVGGTAGYLFDNDEEMYSLHLGMDLSNPMSGWGQALYLEVGYFELSDSLNLFDFDLDPTTGLGSGKSFDRLEVDLQVIPITLNYKLERQIANNLNWYIGLGAGVALLDVDAEVSDGFSSESTDDDDVVFYGQAFTGLVYHVSPSFEIYGGVRYIYFDEPDFDFDGDSVDWDFFEDNFDMSNDDFVGELGVRFNF